MKVYIAMINDGVISLHTSPEEAEDAATREANKLTESRLLKRPDASEPEDVGVFRRVLVRELEVDR